MYSIDHLDTVVELNGAPQSATGAPCPMVLAGEGQLSLAFYLQNIPPGWDGSSVRMVDQDAEGEPCAVVNFLMPRAHLFGPPNDEALHGHPLASRGLRSYSAFEIQRSSWIRQLVQMNSVHHRHYPELFSQDRHFIFTFHDTTFECVAEGWEFSVCQGSVSAALRSLCGFG